MTTLIMADTNTVKRRPKRRKSFIHTALDYLRPHPATKDPFAMSPEELKSRSLSNLACLADEELKLEEDSVEETRRKAEEESLRKQLEAQKREEEKRRREEKM